MGVDYYTCDSCGETFCDCGDYVSCSCDKRWCDYECAESDGFEELDEDENPELDDEERKSCSFCRNENAEDDELLEFALSLLNINRDELLVKFLSNK